MELLSAKKDLVESILPVNIGQRILLAAIGSEAEDSFREGDGIEMPEKGTHYFSSEKRNLKGACSGTKSD